MVKLHETPQDLLAGGTHPNDIFIRHSIGDQNVDSITRGLRAPPVLNVSGQQGIHFRVGLLYRPPRRAGEPRKHQGGGGNVRLECHEKFGDLLEICLVLCQVVTRGHTGGHDENELKRVKQTQCQPPNVYTVEETTHVVDFGEWVNSTGLTTVPPLVGLVDDILQQGRKD